MKFRYCNIKFAQWVYLLPSLQFTLCGWRNEKYPNIIPEKIKGIQIRFCWIFFEFFAEFGHKEEDYYFYD